MAGPRFVLPAATTLAPSPAITPGGDANERGTSAGEGDTADVRGKTYKFDGEWSKAKISQDEYLKTYTATDEEYAQMLQSLISALKKPS